MGDRPPAGASFAQSYARYEHGRQGALDAGKYNGGGVSVAAGQAATAALAAKGDAYGRMATFAKEIIDRLVALATSHGHVYREVAKCREHLWADLHRYAPFAALMLAERTRLSPTGRPYPTGAHRQSDIDCTLEADRVLACLEH